MSPNRQGIETLVSQYLAGGGRVQRIPDPTPATADEILDYLKARKVEIEPARAKNANSARKFCHDGQFIGTDGLLQLANRHRSDEGLAPFDLKDQRRG
jgi:hypothetical protein